MKYEKIKCSYCGKKLEAEQTIWNANITTTYRFLEEVVQIHKAYLLFILRYSSYSI